jgi:hypothetical protein
MRNANDGNILYHWMLSKKIFELGRRNLGIECALNKSHFVAYLPLALPGSL